MRRTSCWAAGISLLVLAGCGGAPEEASTTEARFESSQPASATGTYSYVDDSNEDLIAEAGNRHSGGGVVTETVTIKGLPYLPGDVAVLFQAANLRHGDSLQLGISIGASTYTYHTAPLAISSVPTVARDSYWGPLRSGSQPGVFRFVFKALRWQGNGSAELTRRNISLVMVRTSTQTVAPAMKIRHLLVQPARIGMAASYITAKGTKDAPEFSGGLYVFASATQEPNAVKALRKRYIDGASIGLWWNDVQPDTNQLATSIDQCQGGGTVDLARIQGGLDSVINEGKKINLHVRGINAARLTASKQFDFAGLGAPCWALKAFKGAGPNALPLRDVHSMPKGTPGHDSWHKWLEVGRNAKGGVIEDGKLLSRSVKRLRHLVVENDAGNALYQVVFKYLLDAYPRPSLREGLLGFVSLPSFGVGMDPGSLAWGELKTKATCVASYADPVRQECIDLGWESYLAQPEYQDTSKNPWSGEQWRAWVLDQVPLYWKPALTTVRDFKRPSGIPIYGVLNNSLFNRYAYAGTTWYNTVYEELYLKMNNRLRENLLFAAYSLDSSDATSISRALTEYPSMDDPAIAHMDRAWWHLIDASRQGGATWGEASDTFLGSCDPLLDPALRPAEAIAQFSTNDFREQLGNGLAAAFMVGVRGFEVWLKHSVCLDKVAVFASSGMIDPTVAETALRDLAYLRYPMKRRNTLAAESDCHYFRDDVSGSSCCTVSYGKSTCK